MRVRKESLNASPETMKILILIIGLVLGCVFTFGMSFWNAEIVAGDALRIEATYDSYTVEYQHGKKQQIFVYFQDNEMLTIDSICINDTLEKALSDLPKGAKCILAVHPDSDTILDMKSGNDIILEFDETQEKLQQEKNVFFIIGILMYLSAMAAGISLVIRHRKKARTK